MMVPETKIKTGSVYLCFPTPPEECEYIRIVDLKGEEINFWHNSEWKMTPKYTMGAVFAQVLEGLLNINVGNAAPVAE